MPGTTRRFFVRLLGIWCLAGLSLLGAEPATPQATTATEDQEEWNLIYLGKARLGYLRSSIKNVVENDRKLIRTEAETRLVITRFGQQLKMRTFSVYHETPEGDFVSYEFVQDNPPQAPQTRIGRIKGDQLRTESTIAGKTSIRERKWDTSIKSPAYQDRVLKEKPLKNGEKLTFKAFIPELDNVSDITIKAATEEEVTLLDGSKQKLARMDISQSVLPGFVTRTYLDKEGKMLMSSTPFLGSRMNTYRVTKEEALKNIAGVELDVAMETLVKVGNIDRPYETTKAVYHITAPGEDLKTLIPVGNTQSLKPIFGSEGVELTVTKAPTPKEGQLNNGIIADEYLKRSEFLQAADEKVVEHAKAAVGNATDHWRKVAFMEKYVHEKLNKKNYSTAMATAAEVARSLEGDCTEHSCLLAAMCRAEKIPSRVVVGLVYAQKLEGFAGHMWTEVFVGSQWIPVDATLGQAGIGATHIKFADSSLSDDGPTPALAFLGLLKILGKMKIELISVEYPPQ